MRRHGDVAEGPESARRWNTCRDWVAAGLLIAAYVLIQALTLDYGTRINDLPHIARHRVTSDVGRGSGLERSNIVGAETSSPETSHPETLDIWMVRFKLYSVDADELLNIVALARIKPQLKAFDPRFYQYGGAYLYPLGLYYAVLGRIGLVQVDSLEFLLADPEKMDRIWIAGRAFVLAAVAISAAILFAALRILAPGTPALLALGIYLVCPASIMFSQVLKPHWSALIWVNTAYLILVRAFRNGLLARREQVVLGIVVGLAAGSALSFGLFSILVWLMLALLVHRGFGPRFALFLVPAVALLSLALTNPFYLLSWDAFSIERQAMSSWFEPAFGLREFALFLDNSLFVGLGVMPTVVLLGLGLCRLVRGPMDARLAVLSIFVPMVMIAVLTANMAAWHINFRYLSYELPLILLFLTAYLGQRRMIALTVVFIATLLQAVPLKLAYFDENDPRHSTRLRAAAWLDAHVAPGSSICVGTRTPTPYDVPPFDLAKFRVNALPCEWTVLAERETDSLAARPGLRLIQRFRPRFSPQSFPLVFSHINPQISVYQNSE